MKKLLLVLTAVVAAGGIYYVSRTAKQPPDNQVQGALGGRRLAHGAMVCVSKLQNMTGKPLDMEKAAEDLSGQLSRAGFKPVIGEKSDCQGSVYGDIVELKGKQRMEAAIDFRLMIAGDQTPYISSSAKGKSADPGGGLAGSVPASGMINSMAPGKKPAAAPDVDAAAAGREAIVAAFADLARQIEEQRPSRATRASLN